jgi:8-oxo-dGTP pyrophosphatase MutT (NUDIX family)
MLSSLISSLKQFAHDFPSENLYTNQTIDWINEYRDFAFVKENLDGHITASMLITNPERTKVLLMLHKKFQIWLQFGGHCDGEIDVFNVALREFHEESGIDIDPKILWQIFDVHVHDISARTSSNGMFQPQHKHFDILYLGIIPEDTPFARQEDEVDDIRWFDIVGIEKYISEDRMLQMCRRIADTYLSEK